jgi:transcriptional regulator with XRE-family HTH domain
MFRGTGWFAISVWPVKPSVDHFVGAKLRSIRLSAGHSAQRVATVLFLSTNEVGRMEAGKKRISASQLFALANYLDVPVAAFFDRREVSV